MKKVFKKLTIGILALLVIAVPLIYLTLLNSRPAQAAWYDDSWAYRQAITVTNSGSAQTNFEKMFKIDTSTLVTAGKLQTNCNDLRLTNQAGKLLKHYISNGCNSTFTSVWVIIDSLPANTSTVYMYYGNPSAPSGQVTSDQFTSLTGLIGYWSMDDGSGTSVTDSSANTLTGTWNGTGSPHWDSGKYGQAGVFYRGAFPNHDFITVPDSNTLDQTTDITVEAWIKADVNNVWQGIISKDEYSGAIPNGTQRGYSFAINSDGKFQIRIHGDVNGTTWKQIISTNAISTGTWYHVVFTYNSTNLTLYINGSSDAGTASSAGSMTTLYANLARLAIGSLNGGYEQAGVDPYMDGMIDDVRIYNTTRTASQISSDYSVAIPTTSAASEEKAPGPVAYWSFNEGFGTTTQDATTNNNDGTISGAAWQTEDQCVAGKCLSFDGTDDYVQVLDTSVLDFGTGDFTISAWVKRTSASGSWEWIISKDLLTTDNTGWRFGIRNTDGVYIFRDRLGNVNVAGSTAFTQNTWQYVTVTRTGTALKIYLNAKEDGSGTVSSNFSDSNNLRIGDISSFPAVDAWTGYIDDVKIYPYARTAAQILSDYNSRGSVKGASVNLGAAAPLDGAAAQVYLKMEEGSGTSANDTSTNARTGTLNGGSTWTAGKYGKGVKVDGVSGSNVSVPDFSY